MALKIVKKSDPVVVSQLVLTIHSAPGVGKTATGFTADSPLLLDFDSGSHRPKNRGDAVKFDSWEDVVGEDGVNQKLLEGYKTVIIDTAGRALDLLTLDIIQNDPKMGRGGQLSIQGYGALKGKFISWLNFIKSCKLDVVMLVHSEEKQKGDDVIERLDIQGGSKNEIYKASDVMGRLSISEGKRILNLNPDDKAFGKNPAGLPIIKVPDFEKEPNFLGNLIRQIKDHLSAATEDQKPAREFLEKWQAMVAEAMTAEDFNTLRSGIGEAECSDAVRTLVKKSLSEGAKSRGLKFSKTEDSFVKA